MRASAKLRFSLLACLLTATGCTTRAAAGDSTPAAREQAAALWERAIEAKGGRARLRAVRNFVVSSASRYERSPRPDVASGVATESLYALPGRWWSAWDYRPGKLGHGVNVFDFDAGLGFLSSNGRAASRLDRPDLFADFRQRFREAQYVYLLETDAVRPVPVRARAARINFKKYDVVETTVDGARVDFYLDRETHLPVRILSGATPAARREGRLNMTIKLGDYETVDGVRMPRRVERNDAANQTSYRFNVAFDAGLFTRPPDPSARPGDWAARR